MRPARAITATAALALALCLAATPARAAGAEVPIPPATPPAAPPPPTPGLLFSGDFATCDLSQWPHRQDGGRDDIAAVRSPLATRGSNCSGYFSTGPRDGLGDTAPRNELYRPADAICCNEGDVRWFRWYVRLRRDWPQRRPQGFSTILQFKSADASPGQMSFILVGDRLALRRDGDRWATRMTRGRWHRFLLRVVFSSRSRRGSARLWYDGRRQAVNGGRGFATLANRNGAYVKIGLYRAAGLPRAVLHHDGFRIGRTRRSVTEG